ncbi:MAG TPA: hypothetical protein VM165_21820 [Planctomycetaceae bacterium]|nr:hypothetical protein [Planctomycetaceae bacterium]
MSEPQPDPRETAWSMLLDRLAARIAKVLVDRHRTADDDSAKPSISKALKPRRRSVRQTPV